MSSVWLLRKRYAHTLVGVSWHTCICIFVCIHPVSIDICRSISYCYVYINSLWHSGNIWWNRSVSTLPQAMACCLTAPSHYLNQFWFLISRVLRVITRDQFHRKVFVCKMSLKKKLINTSASGFNELNCIFDRRWVRWGRCWRYMRMVTSVWLLGDRRGPLTRTAAYYYPIDSRKWTIPWARIREKNPQVSHSLSCIRG